MRSLTKAESGNPVPETRHAKQAISLGMSDTAAFTSPNTLGLALRCSRTLGAQHALQGTAHQGS